MENDSASIGRQWVRLLLTGLVAVSLISACATMEDTGDKQAASEQPAQQAQRDDTQADGQVAALYGNDCQAPARQGCNSCQVSCPSDHIAYCAPGTGYQVLITGGIYEYRCTVGPTCSCKKP